MKKKERLTIAFDILHKGEVVAVICYRKDAEKPYMWRTTSHFHSKLADKKQKISHLMKEPEETFAHAIFWFVSNHNLATKDMTLRNHVEIPKPVPVPKRRKAPDEIIRFASSFEDLFTSIKVKVSEKPQSTPPPVETPPPAPPVAEKLAPAPKAEKPKAKSKSIMKAVKKKVTKKK